MLVLPQFHSYKFPIAISSFTVLVMILLFASCQTNQISISQSLEGIWLGCYAELDKKTPRVRLFDLKPDNTYTNIIYEHETVEGGWSAKKNKMLLDTIEYTIGKLAADSLILENNVRVIYKKAIDAPFSQTKTELESSLENTAWESKTSQGITKLLFTYEKVYYLPPNGQLEVFCWKVEKYQEVALLYYRGNKHACNELPSHLKQLTKLNDKLLAFKNYGVSNGNLESFTKVPYKESDIKDLDALNVFQACSLYTRYNCGTMMNVNTQPAKAINYYLNKFKFVSGTENESGFLRLRFLINCKGELANFDLEGMNEEYEAFDFDKKITDQFIHLSKEIDHWIGYERKGEFFDCDKNMLFKIKKGQLVDISP